MRWISHIAIAASLCATVNPGAVPAAVLGSTFPDWSEWLLRAITGRKVRHRGATHYLSTWLLLAGFAALLWDWQGWLLWFALGNVIHWFCDALTVSGAPVGWWSDRRVTLFGGRVKTGSMAELAITVGIVALCAVVIYTRRDVPRHIPPLLLPLRPPLPGRPDRRQRVETAPFRLHLRRKTHKSARNRPEEAGRSQKFQKHAKTSQQNPPSAPLSNPGSGQLSTDPPARPDTITD